VNRVRQKYPGRIVAGWRQLGCGAWLACPVGCAVPLVPRAPEIAGRVEHLAPREQMNLGMFETTWRRVDRWFYDAKFRGVDWPAAALARGPKAMAAKDDRELYTTPLALSF
jgi:hypothetical protein